MRCVEHLSRWNLDPLLERPLISNISTVLSVATIWRLSVKLTRWSTMTTTDYPGSPRVTSLLRRALSLRPIEVL